MKTFALVIATLAAFSVSPAEIRRIGSEPDFTASALATFGGHGSTSASREISTNSVLTLIGFQSFTIDNWMTRAPMFMPTVKKLLAAERWKVETDWSSGVDAQFPYQVHLRASRMNESIELFVTFFPDRDGHLKIAYTQRRSH